jgi:hypothetical protein
MAYSNDPRHGPLRGLDVVNSLGLQGLADNLPDTFGVPNISFTNLSVTTITQTAARDPGFKNFVQARLIFRLDTRDTHTRISS